MPTAEDRPEAPGHLITRVRDLIVEPLDDRISDYQIDGSWPGADPNDAHVHAAAVASRAVVVLTSDSGFTAIDPAGLPYEVHTPDSFFLLVDDSAPTKVARSRPRS